MSLDHGENEMERELETKRNGRRTRGRGSRRNGRGDRREQVVRERSLLRIDILNVEAEEVSDCDAKEIADAVYEALVGGQEGARSHGTDGDDLENNQCWLVSSVLTVCTYANGTTGTCRVNTFECPDGSSYTTKTALA